MLNKYTNRIYNFFLSAHSKRIFEKTVFATAISIFLLYMLLLALIYIGLVPKSIYGEGNIIPNPVSIIYTPFSIILIYEVYLLIYYLPKSITVYIGKQYEVICLILIRGIFEQLANLSDKWKQVEFENLSELLYTFGGLIILLLLIFAFYKLSENKQKQERTDEQGCKEIKQKKFVFTKKILAIGLVLLFIYLFIDSIGQIIKDGAFTIQSVINSIKSLNYTFFSTFFSALIFTEVLLLLFTFNTNECFYKVIRNCGFIISTILLKLSFWASGTSNIILILTGVALGVAMLFIYKLFSERL